MYVSVYVHVCVWNLWEWCLESEAAEGHIYISHEKAFSSELNSYSQKDWSRYMYISSRAGRDPSVFGWKRPEVNYQQEYFKVFIIHSSMDLTWKTRNNLAGKTQEVLLELDMGQCLRPLKKPCRRPCKEHLSYQKALWVRSTRKVETASCRWW